VLSVNPDWVNSCAVWIPLKSYPILQAIKCAVKAWSSPSDVCLACLKAYLVGGAASIFQDGNTIQKDDKMETRYKKMTKAVSHFGTIVMFAVSNDVRVPNFPESKTSV